MLVLTRELDDVIVIGRNIRVRILAIEYGRVKLGIEAPREVEILREELITHEQAVSEPDENPVVSNQGGG